MDHIGTYLYHECAGCRGVRLSMERGVRVLTESLAEAIAAAEKIITEAPHVQNEQDLLEGYDYLAGTLRAAIASAWAFERDFPYFIRSATPYTKVGLDNPDTLYFSARIRDDAEYVVTGRRGTTSDLSFQILNGDYSPADVPGQPQRLRRPRHRDRRRTASFELRFGPPRADAGAELLRAGPEGVDAAGPRGVQRLDHRARRARSASSASTASAPRRRCRTATCIARRYQVAGKTLVQQLKTFLAFPEWFYLKLPVNTMTEPRLTPGGLATQYSSAGHYELADDQALDHHRAGLGRAVPGLPARHDVVPVHGLRQPPDQPHRRAGAARPGRPDAVRGQRARPRRGQLAGVHRAPPRLPADPLAAHVAASSPPPTARACELVAFDELPDRAAVLRPDTRSCRAVGRSASRHGRLPWRTGCWDERDGPVGAREQGGRRLRRRARAWAARSRCSRPRPAQTWCSPRAPSRAWTRWRPR